MTLLFSVRYPSASMATAGVVQVEQVIYETQCQISLSEHGDRKGSPLLYTPGARTARIVVMAVWITHIMTSWFMLHRNRGSEQRFN